MSAHLTIEQLPEEPDATVGIRETFRVDTDARAPAFSLRTPHVPAIDSGYRFDPGTTMAIIAGFADNRRVIVQGRHGTGKSTHVEQVAARLNWPLVRLNLDSHISRIDLIGKDAIVLRDGKQVTEYREGILPWSYQHPVALVFDEYDAGRPDVMFVIQRVLEAQGRLTILDQNKVLVPHKSFRLFATANTIGLGDATGLYHGTQQLNQAQLDRWNIVARLDYLREEEEVGVVLSKVPSMSDEEGRKLILQMVRMADMTRTGFQAGDISTLMSPRTVISWADNFRIFNDLDYAFAIAFLNRCDEAERPLVAEYYQRSTGRSLDLAATSPWKRVD
ncbi:AAA family ATPase [Bradyrhizobium liaoningense]|uniref:AAA family ATPase n=1 Tax=Bradyrhizobium liaoningense TaxID=43992 RepID=UPI001BAC6AB9|nr:AAA family ATPase [Bradyrhizobium liaoningense]MBR0840401.1 AAA family ATPase [Bradyrhizobium liaoningense]